MKVVSNENFKVFKVLAEKNDWSLAYAEGYVEGENARRRSKTPPRYAWVGIDEYCLGFRAAYFERRNPSSMRSGNPATLISVPGRVRSG